MCTCRKSVGLQSFQKGSALVFEHLPSCDHTFDDSPVSIPSAFQHPYPHRWPALALVQTHCLT